MEFFRRIIFSFFVLSIFLSNAPVEAASKTPKEINGIEVVNHDYVKSVVESGNALIIDFRLHSQFLDGTIPGAVNCPGIEHEPENLDEEQIAEAESVISSCKALSNATRDREIIAFCVHKRCWISPKGALALKKMGFTKVKWFRKGIDKWKEKGYDLVQFSGSAKETRMASATVPRKGETKLTLDEVRTTFIGTPWHGPTGAFLFRADGTYTFKEFNESEPRGTWSYRNNADGTLETSSTSYTFYKSADGFRYFHSRSKKFYIAIPDKPPFL